MKKLKTWAGRSSFSYTESIKSGTKIYYGKNNQIRISARDYRKLLDYFEGKTVNIGTSRTNPPAGSIGGWLQENVTPVAIASYVGSILINEGYAEKVGGPDIKIYYNI